MDAELSLDETAISYVEVKIPSLLEDRERIIEICNELLCSGRPLADVLDEVRRLSEGPTRDSIKLGAPAPKKSAEDARSSVRASSPAPLVQASPSQLANPHSSAPVAQYGLVQRLKLLRTTIVALVAIVVSLVTMVAYFEFGNAGQRTHEHIRQQLRKRGQLISNSLRPALDNAELKDMPRLSAALKGHADGVQAIRLLFAPGGGESFYYAASWPDAGENFEAQRQHLVGLGILGRLPASCHNGIAFELLSSGPTADREAVAVNPLWTPLGCWVVVTSFAIDSFPGAQETPAS